jgi:hypothetical protein
LPKVLNSALILKAFSARKIVQDWRFLYFAAIRLVTSYIYTAENRTGEGKAGAGQYSLCNQVVVPHF